MNQGELFEYSSYGYIRPSARCVHANSVESFHGSKNAISDRRRAVLEVYQARPGLALTDRQVLAHLYPGKDDLNMVRPRITELIEEGLLVETGRMKCLVTGKMVRTVSVP